MAERNKRTQALILSVKAQGEQNRNVCVLSADLGLFYATLYGGPKSKLRSLIQPFYAGTLWFYDDGSRRSKKIVDFEVAKAHFSLRGDLYKLWAANLATELLLKTRCAGDEARAFVLLSAFIDGIEASDEPSARMGTLRFLWRYLGLLGIQPDLAVCASCGAPLAADSLYVPGQQGFVCADCMSAWSGADTVPFPLSAAGRQYLRAVNEAPPKVARAMEISAPDASDIKRLVFYLAEQAAETRLQSLATGMGIL